MVEKKIVEIVPRQQKHIHHEENEIEGINLDLVKNMEKLVPRLGLQESAVIEIGGGPPEIEVQIAGHEIVDVVPQEIVMIPWIKKESGKDLRKSTHK